MLMHWTSGNIPWEFSLLDVMVQDGAEFLQPLPPLRMFIQLAGGEKGIGEGPWMLFFPKSALFFTL